MASNKHARSFLIKQDQQGPVCDCHLVGRSYPPRVSSSPRPLTPPLEDAGKPLREKLARSHPHCRLWVKAHHQSQLRCERGQQAPALDGEARAPSGRGSSHGWLSLEAPSHRGARNWGTCDSCLQTPDLGSIQKEKEVAELSEGPEALKTTAGRF